jgi:hypothetical protein
VSGILHSDDDDDDDDNDDDDEKIISTLEVCFHNGI